MPRNICPFHSVDFCIDGRKPIMGKTTKREYVNVHWSGKEKVTLKKKVRLTLGKFESTEKCRE